MLALPGMRVVVPSHTPVGGMYAVDVVLQTSCRTPLARITDDRTGPRQEAAPNENAGL